MHTLREIGDFVGIPQNSGEFGSYQPIGLRLIGDLAEPVSGGSEHRSIRGLLALLSGLPPVTLEANLLSKVEGREPYQLVVRLSPSSGLIISTRIMYDSAEGIHGVSQNYQGVGGDKEPTGLGVGKWTVTVRRCGISNTGYVILEKAFGVQVSSKPVAVTRPRISVSPHGPIDAMMFSISGGGFLPDRPVSAEGIAIRVIEGVNRIVLDFFHVGSDASRNIRHEWGPLNVLDLPRNALSQALLEFAATDGRVDSGSVPAGEILWSETLTVIL